jgi:hypothetical protein
MLAVDPDLFDRLVDAARRERRRASRDPVTD